VILEVDALLGRVWWESWSVQNDELEVCAKLLLAHPREVTVADASVHENETLHRDQRNHDRNAPR